MPSGSYRYYRLDGSGRLYSAEWFDAFDDEDAVSQIETKYADGKCEIWQGDRLVAKLSHTDPGLSPAKLPHSPPRGMHTSR
jgi:hypothetical protein